MARDPRRRALAGSLAAQILALQLAVVVVLVGGGVALAYLDARGDALAAARTRAVDVARSIADSPTTRDAVATADPTAVLQPYAETVRLDTATDFVVVMDLDGTRYTHPDPREIGETFLGSIDEARAGEVYTEEYEGTLGRSVRAVVPVQDDGDVVALVSVGITLDRVRSVVGDRLPAIGLAALVVLAVGTAGAWAISRRVREQTHAMGPAELGRMYAYYDSVLHSVREGLVLLDREGRVRLVNDEARVLLDLGDDVVGRPVTDLGLPDDLAAALAGATTGPDEIHVLDRRVVVVNQSPAERDGGPVGSVVTMRDHTDLLEVAGELDVVRGLSESLRAQNHEAANRLHTVVSLVEMGRTEQAVAFATDELALAQTLTDSLVSAVDEPVLAALLLGKSAQAAERGVLLRVDAASHVDALAVPTRDAVTILGNLLDNALDAAAEHPPAEGVPVVEVEVRGDGTGLVVRVDDSGAGIPPARRQEAFRRGWSTKADGGRGLGLALVGQVVRSHGGTVSVHDAALGGASLRVDLPGPGGDRA